MPADGFIAALGAISAIEGLCRTSPVVRASRASVDTDVHNAQCLNTVACRLTEHAFADGAVGGDICAGITRALNVIASRDGSHIGPDIRACAAHLERALAAWQRRRTEQAQHDADIDAIQGLVFAACHAVLTTLRQCLGR